jgi:hypothetical protein
MSVGDMLVPLTQINEPGDSVSKAILYEMRGLRSILCTGKDISFPDHFLREHQQVLKSDQSISSHAEIQNL